MKLEDVIRKQLAEATAQLAESKKTVELKEPTESDEVGGADKVDLKPTLKKELTKESLDSMSDSDLVELVEGYDQLDEISKNTVASYVIKRAENPKDMSKTQLGKKHSELADKSDELQDSIHSNAYAKHQSALYSAKKTPSKENLNSLAKAQLELSKAGSGAKGKYDKDVTDADDIDQRHADIDDQLTNSQKANSKSKDRAMARLTKESTADSKVSDQVSALLEAEGLSDEFKVQAVTIFEAAVTDRVLQIQEEMKQDFEAQLVEAKAQMETDIDGFLSEAVAKWHEENEVAIKSNFNTQVAESFMDGLSKLIAEHNIEVPTGKEDALATALSEVDKLNEELKARADEVKAIQETVKKLEAGKILESFKEKMTSTEFDRFTQLTESVVFATEDQYKKQLSVVLENFGSKQKPAVAPKKAEIITEEIVGATKVETVTDSNVAKYAAFLTKR